MIKQIIAICALMSICVFTGTFIGWMLADDKGEQPEILSIEHDGNLGMFEPPNEAFTIREDADLVGNECDPCLDSGKSWPNPTPTPTPGLICNPFLHREDMAPNPYNVYFDDNTYNEMRVFCENGKFRMELWHPTPTPTPEPLVDIGRLITVPQITIGADIQAFTFTRNGENWIVTWSEK